MKHIEKIKFVPSKQEIDYLFLYRVTRKVRNDCTIIIILDEAQFLKNSILNDLRIIFNFQMDSKDCAVLILSRQTQFISQIQRQPHEALRQRIVVNYSLKGLTLDEVKLYIPYMLKIAVCSEPIFTDDALENFFIQALMGF